MGELLSFPSATIRSPAMLEAFGNWLVATGRSEGTARLYVGRVRQFSLVHPDLTHATLYDIEQFLAERRGLAANTRKTFKSALCAYFHWAKRMGIIKKDPTKKLDAVRVPATAPRVVPNEVVQMGLLTAPEPLDAMAMLARFGCLRLTEFTTLHTRQREHDLLRIKGKGDKERLVPMNEQLLAVILRLEREQGAGYYFPGRYGGHWHPQSVTKLFVRHFGYSPHSFRHAGATAAYEATHDIRAVQLLLGHSSMATTQRYLHIGFDAVRTAAAGTAFVAPITAWPTTSAPPVRMAAA